MKFLLITLVALTAAGLYLSLSETQEQSLFKEYKQWKSDHYKNHNGDEDAYRYSVFSQNKQFVQQFNAEQSGSLRLGMNVFADLTNEEYIQQVIQNGGLYEEVPEENVHVFPESNGIPQQVNWTKSGQVTPVENQGRCGSCWAFSVKESLEGLYVQQGNNLTVLSAQQLTACAKQSFGCSGGYQASTYTYVAANGITTEEVYPYVSGNGVDYACTYNPVTSVFKNKSYAKATQYNEQSTLSAAAQQPTSVLVAASSLVFQLYQSGIMNNAACGTRTDHAILMVGYDITSTVQSEQYYLVKNSWGTGWGDQGYAQIVINGDGAGQCAIQTSVEWPTA